MSKTGDIRNMQAYNNIKGTVSDFAMFKKYGLRAATDVDFLTVQHGHALFLEGKQLNGGIECKVPIGQARALGVLDKPDNQHAFIVAYSARRENRKYYIAKPQQFSDNVRQDQNNIWCGYMRLEAMIGPFSEKEFCKWTNDFVKSFEVHKQ